MSKSKVIKCAWGCGASAAQRKCRVCAACIIKRNEKNARLDKDWTKYVPPHLRPGHRLFERLKAKQSRTGKPLTAEHKAKMLAGQLAAKAKRGLLPSQDAQDEGSKRPERRKGKVGL